MNNKLSCKIQLKTRERPLFGEVSRTKLERFFTDDNDFLTIESESDITIFKGDIARIIIFTESESIIIGETELTLITKLTEDLGVA